MIAAILSTGTELTRGELNNTNSTWIAEELTLVGIEVATILTVDDNTERIAEAFEALSHKHDCVICTGGLGPTTDDVTAAALAQACRVELECDEVSLLAIEARLQRLGRAMTPSNARQAQLPKGSMRIPNANGTAPGFSIALNGSLVFCLPGVPDEMKPMFSESVLVELQEKRERCVAQVVLRTLGLAESAVNDSLAGIAEEFGVTLGYRVHFPELAVKVISRGASQDAALAVANCAADRVLARLGSQAVFGRGNATLPEVVATRLRSQGLKLAVAESCTGGQVCSLLTGVAGVSDVFMGGVVAYANDVKRAVLGVPAETLQRHGAVSPETAVAMAEGVRSRLCADFGLAITGIAGPTGGTKEKPLGTVHFAVVGPGLSRHQHRLFLWDRSRIQRASTYLVLNWLRCLLDDPEAAML